jgi:hypothetical protein
MLSLGLLGSQRDLSFGNVSSNSALFALALPASSLR